MGDVDDYEDDIKDLLNKLSDSISTIAKKDPSQKNKIVSKCEVQCQEITTRMESFELDILSLDKSKAVPYKKKYQQLEAEFSKLQSSLEKAKNNSTTDNTLMQNENFQVAQKDGSEALIEMGKYTQKKGLESLKRTKLLVDDANSIADDINAELLRQLSQLDKADDNLNAAKTDIQRAGEIIKYFSGQLAKDKFLLIMVLLVIAAISAVVVLKVRIHFNGSNQADVPSDLVLKAYSKS